MALAALLLLVFLFSILALAGWRTGIVLVIVLAAVQDPIRKLVPGTPGWLVLLTAPVFAAAVIGSVMKHRTWWADFRREHRTIAEALVVLCILSLPAAAISATYSPGSWMLTLLGAFSYSVIFLGMIAGFHFARSERDVRQLLVAYCLIHGAMLCGTYLDYLHVFPNSRIIGSRALGYEWIRWGWGYTVDMVAGLYRTADVMGWHAASVAMISVILAWTAKGTRRWTWFALGLFAAGALMLCGRRKMVYMLPVFLVCVGYLFWQAGRSGRVMALVAFLAIPAAGVFVVSEWIGEESSNIRYYRGDGLQQDAMESVRTQGFSSVVTTFNQAGVFGAGLGVATPGSQHIGVKRPKVWQESTTSRIMVELGLPGVLGFLLVMGAIAVKLWRISIFQLRAHTRLSIYAGGLVGFFMANVGSLVVSGQILADPFIAAFLGFLVGVALSVPRMAKRARAAAEEAPARVPKPVTARLPIALPAPVMDLERVNDLRSLPW